MSLETFGYIDDLDQYSPDGATEYVSQGDDHIRGIKATLKLTFPNFTGPVTASNASINAGILPINTCQLFMQAAAPTGWTQVVSHNNKALRIVSGAGAGSGGAESFTTIFNNGTTKSTNSFALTTAELPAHTHNINLNTNSTGNHSHTTAINRYTNLGSSAYPGFGGGTNGVFSTTEYYASNTVGLHAHNVSGATASAGVGGGHSHTLTMNLQYVDIIACTKDI